MLSVYKVASLSVMKLCLKQYIGKENTSYTQALILRTHPSHLPNLLLGGEGFVLPIGPQKSQDASFQGPFSILEVELPERTWIL